MGYVYWISVAFAAILLAEDGESVLGWSKCTKTCGFGSQRSLGCMTFQDGRCLFVHKGCNRQPCPDDTVWAACSVTCGRGVQKGFRVDGSNTMRVCQKPQCESEPHWSNCTKPCGNGTRFKFSDLMCKDPNNFLCRRTFELCNSDPCPEVTCSKGQRLRFKRNDKCCNVVLKRSARKPLPLMPRSRGKWPWMVVITRLFKTCDGSLIHNQFVLTAAHCVMEGNRPASKIFAHVGVLDWRNPGFYDRHLVSKVIPYPGYKNYQEDDIALLKLARPVKASVTTKFIALPHGEATPASSICFNTGWHNTTVAKARREDMGEMKVQIFDLQACRTAYSNVPRHTKTLCYGSALESNNKCKGGYSGSAVVCQRCATCQWYIAGVHSYSSSVQNCPNLKKPRGAVKVVAYEEWIMRHVPSLREEEYDTTGCTRRLKTSKDR